MLNKCSYKIDTNYMKIKVIFNPNKHKLILINTRFKYPSELHM